MKGRGRDGSLSTPCPGAKLSRLLPFGSSHCAWGSFNGNINALLEGGEKDEVKREKDRERE